jgi:ABC-2 type transport system permease protein
MTEPRVARPRISDPRVPGPADPLPPTPMGTVLAPKWRSAAARLRQERSGAPTKILLLALVGGGFWSALFAIAFRVLHYARNAPEIGAFLPGKMLGVVLLAFASILLLSNLITSLSTFFLAKDLDLLMSAPVDWFRFYVSKLAETAVHSSWMVALLAFPIFTAYGIVYGGGPLFPLVALAAFLPFLVLPAVIGTAVTLLLVNIFPARRTRDLLGLVAIGAAGTVAVGFRMLQPEQLARPEGFRNLLDFLSALRTPASPWLPTEWATRMVMNWLERVADPLPIVLLWTTAAAFVVFGAALHRRLYRDGFAKAQEGAERFVQGRGWPRAAGLLLRPLPVSKREFILKDLRLFFRDSTQWSQLILLGVLILVYLFNIKALPLFSGERISAFLITGIVFLNLGLAGFVLAAIAARFVFPSVSLEGRQMWLLRSSPLEMQALLWSKYWTGTLPLLVVAVFLTIATNYILQASPFMMALSLGTIVLFTLAASAMALSFGAIYPQFETENAAQIPTSFGGLVFMMSSVLLLGVIIVLEARPVLAYLRAQQMGETLSIDADMALALGGVAVVCIAATLTSLHVGLKRVEAMDW